MTGPADADGYRGPVTLWVGAAAFEVQADLRGKFEPIDGRYHWYGRLGRSDILAAALASGRAQGMLCTAQGTAECEVSDPDPWLRFRVSGISRPPFTVGIGAGGANPSPGHEPSQSANSGESVLGHELLPSATRSADVGGQASSPGDGSSGRPQS